MPTYNRARFIGEALDSLLLQHYPPTEVIVVDDCSSDDTADVVRTHPLGGRIQYRLQSIRSGASVARNIGVEIATGAIIVFLDSDDILEPGHHEAAINAFDSDSTVGLFCCDSRMIGPTGEVLGDKPGRWLNAILGIYQITTGRRSLADVFLFSTPFPGLSVRRRVYREVGGLDQSLFPLDDLHLQLKVAGHGYGVQYQHEALARYRVHDSNESGFANAVRVGEQKLACIRVCIDRYPELRGLKRRATRRLGEVRRELAIAHLRRGISQGV